MGRVLAQLEFSGTYFDGLSTRAYPVAALVADESLTLHGDGVEVSAPLKSVRIEPALGTTRRVLVFSEGARLETDALEAVAGLERTLGQNWELRLTGWLEAHWGRVLGCLAGLAVAVWAVAVYGIPWGARVAAFATPPGVLAGVSERSLALLDDRILEPSRLGASRRETLRAAFGTLTSDLGSPPFQGTYRLVFRKGGAVGPNAFALPSGLIIVTDELVRLSQNDRELLSVLAHEVGHVEARHGLRGLYQSTGVFVLVSVLSGDVVSAGSVAAGLPTLLLETGYSRRFEREADAVAARYALERGWGTGPLERILTRLSGDADGVPAFLSTHPATLERIKALKAQGDR